MAPAKDAQKYAFSLMQLGTLVVSVFVTGAGAALYIDNSVKAVGENVENLRVNVATLTEWRQNTDKKIDDHDVRLRSLEKPGE